VAKLGRMHHTMMLVDVISDTYISLYGKSAYSHSAENAALTVVVDHFDKQIG
jgi:hypothetical protein